LIGPEAIGAFFRATSGMYQSIAFTSQTDRGGRSCLEWEGRIFDKDVAGATIITRNTSGLIHSVRLYHRPFTVVGPFATELGARLSGKVDQSVLA